MPGPLPGWLVGLDGDDGVFELINQARTAAYLADPVLTIDGIDICSILDFGGCENYAWTPNCDGDYGGWVDLPGEAGDNLVIPRTELRDAYASKGTAPLTTADTGQTWQLAGAPTASIISGKVGIPQGVAGASYWHVPLSGKVRRTRARWTWTSAGTTNDGNVAILAWANTFVGNPFPPDSHLHLSISPLSWGYGAWLNQSFVPLASGTFSVPLLTDDTTVYTCEVVINGDTATIALPDGTSSPPITDPLIGSISGTFAGYEIVQQTTSHSPRFLDFEADIYPVSLDIRGDITVVVRMAPDDWTPAAPAMVPVSKRAGAGQLSYVLRLTSAGALQFVWSVDGTAVLSLTSIAAFAALPGSTWKYVAFTLDVDNGAGQFQGRFWQSDDGIAWTQVGTTFTVAGTTSIFVSNANTMIGAEAGGATFPFNGMISHVSIRDGIGAGGVVGGTEVFRFDENALHQVPVASTTLEAITGQTITVNRSGTPSTTLVPFVAAEDWLPLTFDTPTADPAPWYNSSYPESADALGFFVEEWTGLDDKHVTRSMTRTGRDRGGASPGVIANRDRVMKLNIFLFASSEEGMSYLFRWFAALLESICSACSSNSMLTRDYCGSVEETSKGVVEMRNVALIEGLGWEADLIERGTCFLRRASFTLAAGDPCLYLPDTEPVVTAGTSDLGPGLLTANYNLTRSPARPSCSELPATTRQSYTWDAESAMGAKAPVITFHNDNAEHAFPFRAILYHDVGEIGVAPNPCGMPRLGEIYVRPMPPYSFLKWDVAAREISYRDPTTGTWVESWFLLQANDEPLSRYFVLPCAGDHHLVLEPGTLQIARVGVVGNVFEWNDIIFSSPHYPDVEIAIVERVSCS